MYIQSIYGKNVSNYDEIEYNFKDGLTLINGDNKSGKSSLIDIIRFSLYGNCIKSKKIEYFKKRGSKGDLVTQINFLFNGNNWVIKRVYGKKEKTANLFIDGEEKASGISNVDSYLSDNFINEPLLINSNLCQQKDSSGLLEVGDSEKFNITKRIFSLDEFKKKAEIVKKDIAKIEEEYSKKTFILSANKKELEEIEKLILELNIDKLRKDLELLGLSRDENNNNLLVKEKEVSFIEKEILDIIDKNKIIEDSNKEYYLLKKSIEDKKIKIDCLVNKKEKERSNKDILLKSIKDMGDEALLKNKESSGISLIRVKKFNSEELTSVYSRIKEIEVEEKNIKLKLDFLSKEICPTCGQKISNLDLTTLKKELDNFLIEKEGLSNKLNKLYEDKKECESKEKELSESKDKKSKIISDIEKLEIKIESSKKQIELIDNTVEGIISNISELESFIAEETLKLNKISLKDVIDAKEVYNKKSLVEKEVSDYKLKISDINDKIKIIENSIFKYEIHIAKKDEVSYKILSLEKEINDLSGKINDYSEVKLIFEKKLPLYMVLNKLNFVSKKSNDFLHKILDKYEISFEQNKDNLSIVFTDLVSNTPSDYNNLSGFESTLGGIAIRMGFSLYNSTFNKDCVNWIILDEVDSSFTDKNSELLYKTIFNLKSMFKQIIMVTHKSEIKEFIQPNDVIEVKNNGVNSYISYE